MQGFRPFTPARLGLAASLYAIVGLIGALGARTGPASSRPVAAGPTAVNHGDAIYVGEQVCIACHAVPNKHFTHTVHASAFRDNPKNELHQRSCEACHGPGSNHIKNPTDPANRASLIGFTREWGTPVEVQNAMCLTCHQGAQRMFWPDSTHARNELACSDCHNPMARISPTGLLKKESINDTCYTCHQQQRTEFAKRSHMPLPEGKMSCVDCHNPHGSTSKAMIKADSVNELCYNCHTEKRGPFLWEHAPVRDNCLNCHHPHGSNHDKLLTVARPFSCQQCHTNPGGHQTPLFNAGQLLGGGGAVNSRVLSRSCQQCHSQIHGSNHPAGARFQR